ncbi:conserved exported hypothetical protein [Methylocella tundrae]|uniref:Uncharacterized protein n=2 Tax=Methylocella tundrae TaxID=227605 RepID=A0A4U8Z242_METTU|nr:conserved exported protein of unknown function [Methylocella tundrae]VTZ27818.1 conserved exported hypothetical protein [Methylocella tundrae]VTZ48360.1 conserved exported hypothetical protein [Methylocella tundrae]
MMANSLILGVRKAAAFGALAICFGFGGVAHALDCNEDIASLTKKRQVVIDDLNRLAKGSKNQLDPVASCPKLKALVGAERELLAYLTKNKEWCSVPDNALENITLSAQKSGSVAAQACKIAAQVTQMKKAQEQGGGLPQGQKLPAGPL